MHVAPPPIWLLLVLLSSSALSGNRGSLRASKDGSYKTTLLLFAFCLMLVECFAADLGSGVLLQYNEGIHHQKQQVPLTSV